MSPTIDDLKALLLSRLGANMKHGAVDADTPLFEGGLGLDSLAVVDMITALEVTFELRFSDDDLVVENFATLSAISALIARYRPKTPAPVSPEP